MCFKSIFLSIRQKCLRFAKIDIWRLTEWARWWQTHTQNFIFCDTVIKIFFYTKPDANKTCCCERSTPRILWSTPRQSQRYVYSRLRIVAQRQSYIFQPLFPGGILTTQSLFCVSFYYWVFRNFLLSCWKVPCILHRTVKLRW